MKIEYNPILPPQNKRFECHKCGSRFIAEGKDKEWFVKNAPAYLPPTYIAYCPICGAECHVD